MELILTADERAGLVAAAAEEGRVRRWRRFQALLYVADQPAHAVQDASSDCHRIIGVTWRAALSGYATAVHLAGVCIHR